MAASAYSTQDTSVFPFPVDQVQIDPTKTPEPYNNGLRIFQNAPVNWVGNNECNLHSTAIITQYAYHDVKFYYIIYEVSSSNGATMEHGWLPFAYAGGFLEGEWEDYKNDSEEFTHSGIIKDLRDEATNCFADLLSASITDGGDATRSLAEETMILTLSGQLTDIMDKHIAAMKARAKGIKELDEVLDDILKNNPPGAQGSANGA
ncbi:uncharacterized protein N0V89_009956 [Didymosphaeria variabile]|uniref:Uncharacterized protein n=1 Tax=Didymosphaeria variabile TaxID=1932322 RepID=A0A9W8XGL2_9PLEO|nr:uncharacterized protein N0V89_009956 [Didymosphaeria variabile]KAJ4348578.1 hypothetical protein N0V89_009956 [Didymosphaeria variabile]